MKIAFISDGDYIFKCAGLGMYGICQPLFPHGVVPDDYPLDDEDSD